MPRLQAFKFELMPDGGQARIMRRFAGARRFVFNQALALQQARYSEGQTKLSYAGLCKHLTAWRHSAQTPLAGADPFAGIAAVAQRPGARLCQFPCRAGRFPPLQAQGAR